MSVIENISCHKIVNSRGDWTIRTRVLLNDGSVGIQTIPDGASKGKREAIYVPVEKSVQMVSDVINDALKGEDPSNQGKIDRMLVEIDGTKNKKHLGANSILSVSLAACKAAARSKGIPLYRYLAKMFSGDPDNFKFPTPVFNVINGGKHANNNLSFQEFMVIPAGRISYDKAYEMGVRIYQSIENLLKKEGMDVDIGDEGGFAPNNLTVDKALSLLHKAAGEKYKVGDEVFFGLDVAADSFKKIFKYVIEEEGLHLSGDEMINYYRNLLHKYPIIYLEDPFYEDDHTLWAKLYEEFSRNVFIVGDDLLVTNPQVLEQVIQKDLANAAIVKPNQIGTLTETLEFIKLAQEANMQICVSHRSGDTAEDTFIADLSVAVGADFIKSGAPARGE